MNVPPLLIRCIVDDAAGKEVANYVFDINDYRQRRIFAEQMTDAYLAGQLVTTYADQWSERRAPTLKAFQARSWIERAAPDYEEPAP